METIIPKLYASAPESLGFGPSLEIRAFLLQRERDNLLIYRAATLEQDVEEINDLGGICASTSTTTTRPHPPATGSPEPSTRRFTFTRRMRRRLPKYATSPRPSPSARA